MQIIAGPCSWESKEQCHETIEFLHDKVDYIRGGIFKYRSDPKTFQGERSAIDWIEEAKRKWDFKYVVEVFEKLDLDAFEHIADMWQIGSRNMFNTNLLKLINSTYKDKPVLLKRHYAASLTEFLKHSEYLNNCDVTLCLRGIMSLFPQDKRFQSDFDDISRLKNMTDKKVIYDVSHSSGHATLVPPSILAAKAFGADGIMIEIHPSPLTALSDPDQQINFEQFSQLKREKYL